MVLFLAGVLTWGGLEYVLHRFVGHARRIRTEFGREHTRHHAEGSYFAPTPKKIAAAAPVVAGAAALVALLVGTPAAGLSYGAGLGLTYALYEILHRRAHTHPPAGPYGRWLRRHHFHHHFGDPRTNHGVTSPIGDILAGTRVQPGRIRVPEKLAMAWLLDPATGDVAAAYAADYELVRRPR